MPPARDTIARHLDVFYANSRLTDIGGAAVERIDDKAFVLRPPSARSPGGAHDVDLVLMALTHGNEYGGLPVLNAVCDYIRKGTVSPAITVGFALGNVEAALQGRRFLDRDMNRSFDRVGTGTIEDRRARQVERLLRRTRYLVDLHQTNEPTDTPFFVFIYQESNLRFAQAISPAYPVVTHWGRPFSATDHSATSDEYVNRQGGIGVGIELGQAGLDPYHTAVGIQACLNAITAITWYDRGVDFPGIGAGGNPIYTWGDIVPYPPGRVVLDDGWRNFQPVESGQRLGLRDGKPIRAAKSGLMLFPKYVRSESDPRPAELYRLLRRPALHELGKGDCLVSAQ